MCIKLSRHMIIPLTLIASGNYLLCVYIANEDGRYKMNMISTSLSFIFFAISLMQIFIMVFIGLIPIVFRFLYFRYRFKELYVEIQQCARPSRIFINLNFAIIKHCELIKLTEMVNKTINVFIFLIYYMSSSTCLILVYIAQSTSSITPIRVGAAFTSVLIFINLIIITLLSSPIGFWAKKPTKHLLRYIGETRLSLRQRLRITQYIEHLNGAHIGFYCLDLFPMTSYQFYLYVANCCATYFLLLSF